VLLEERILAMVIQKIRSELQRMECATRVDVLALEEEWRAKYAEEKDSKWLELADVAALRAVIVTPDDPSFQADESWKEYTRRRRAMAGQHDWDDKGGPCIHCGETRNPLGVGHIYCRTET